MRVFRHIVGKKFQGDIAMQTDVLRLVHHTHAAATKLFDDGVVGNCFSDERVGVRHGCRNLRLRASGKSTNPRSLECRFIAEPVQLLINGAGSNGRCNTIWYKAAFKGGVYEARETVWAFRGAED